MFKKGIQSNALEEMSVKIDGKEITMTQVTSLNVKWNIENFRVSAVLTFLDHTGLVEELPIRGGNKVEITIKDFDEQSFIHTFIVVAVNNTRSVSSPIVTLNLLDPITVKSINMYIEKSWPKADITKIIDDATTLKPLLTKKKKNFMSGAPKFKNFVIPLHVSFNVLTHWLAKHSDVMWYQNREEYVIQPLKKIFSLPPKDTDKYILKTDNVNYRRNIFEFKINMGNMFNTTILQPPGTVTSYDPTDKSYKITENSFKKSVDEIGAGGTFGSKMKDYEFKGSKYFYKSDNNVESVTKFQWEKNAYKDIQLEILVPGQFKTNIGDVVSVDMINWKDQTSAEKNIDGDWLVTEIIDVIEPPEFIQRITLSRSKYFK